MGHPIDNAVTCVPTSFEGTVLVTVDNEGSPAWAATQIGQALGYEDGRKLTDLVRSDWKDEFEEGVDFRLASRSELIALKGVGAIPKKTPSLLLLTESGVNMAAILSRQPAAKRLRQWLAREVLPQLRLTGAYGAPENQIAVVSRESRRAAEIGMLVNIVLNGEAPIKSLVWRMTDAEIGALDEDTLRELLIHEEKCSRRSDYQPHARIPESVVREKLCASVKLRSAVQVSMFYAEDDIARAIAPIILRMKHSRPPSIDYVNDLDADPGF